MGAAVYFWNYVGKPEAVGDTLLSWKCVLVNKKRKKVWLAGPFCLFWTVWKARNRIVFKDEFFFFTEGEDLFCLPSLDRNQKNCTGMALQI